MNNRHRLVHKLEREEKRRKTRELIKLGEEVFESGFNPVVSLLPPILKKQNIQEVRRKNNGFKLFNS